MKKIILSICIILCFFYLNAQNFQGTIIYQSLKKEAKKNMLLNNFDKISEDFDTIYLSYITKENFCKNTERHSSSKFQNIMNMDRYIFNNEIFIAQLFAKSLYKIPEEAKKNILKECIAQKKIKTISGYRCYLYTIDKTSNLGRLHYDLWITDSIKIPSFGFPFFKQGIVVESNSSFYNEKDKNYILTNDKLISVEPSVISDSVFMFPENFKATNFNKKGF